MGVKGKHRKAVKARYRITQYIENQSSEPRGERDPLVKPLRFSRRAAQNFEIRTNIRSETDDRDLPGGWPALKKLTFPKRSPTASIRSCPTSGRAILSSSSGPRPEALRVRDVPSPQRRTGPAIGTIAAT